MYEGSIVSLLIIQRQTNPHNKLHWRENHINFLLPEKINFTNDN